MLELSNPLVYVQLTHLLVFTCQGRVAAQRRLTLTDTDHTPAVIAVLDDTTGLYALWPYLPALSMEAVWTIRVQPEVESRAYAAPG